jgi:hypothetical protein
MIKLIKRLWCGEESLPRAFWEYAILYGTLVNLITTAGTFAVLALGLSGGIALAIHVLPIPYNIFVVVAVWRSAQHYKGPQEWGLVARIGVIVWALIASLA